MIPRLNQTLSQGVYGQFPRELRVAGFSGEITLTAADRTAFATDNSIYQLEPRAIVFPRDRSDLVRIASLARSATFREIKLAPRGGGTGTNGQSLTDGVVVDVSRFMNRVIEINVKERWARVEPGVIKDELNAALLPFGLFFAPELSSSSRATIGGMIMTDASGQGSCRYGKTRNHVLDLTCVLMGGTVWQSVPIDSAALDAVCARQDTIGAIHRTLDDIARHEADLIALRFPRLNRCLTGYDLAHIRDASGHFDLNSVLCGSEGTLAFVAEAKINLEPIPAETALVSLQYETFDAALRDAMGLMSLSPTSVETIDSLVLRLAREDPVWGKIDRFFPENGVAADGINLVEFTANSREELEALLTHAIGRLAEKNAHGRRSFTIARGKADVGAIWLMRKKAVGLLGNVKGGRRPVPFVEDTAVPPEHLADYIAEFRAILDRRGLFYGMFGHVDAGVLHVRPALDLTDPADESIVREISDEVFALVGRYGGLLWGEHGKGVRSQYSPEVFGPLYLALQKIKTAFDPGDQLNPGKVASPPGGTLLSIDGVPTRGQSDRTIAVVNRQVFDDALHCNGNGACFTFDRDEAMCPSWKARGQRRHSPKGRAALTREWLRRLAPGSTDLVAEAGRAGTGSGLGNFARRIRNTAKRGLGEYDFSHEVKEAMDGCLACKACSGSCPVKVDVPTFRSKFLELYYGRYLRPPREHLVARLEQLLPWAALLPAAFNLVVGSPPGRALLRWLGLVALPLLSRLDFARELARRGVKIATPARLAALSPEDRAASVVFVADGFTRFFETPLVLDCIDLARKLGFTPWMAPYLPTGKPLHVMGFLGAFNRTARQTAATLRALEETGVELVGTDPSMTLVFRDEYVKALGKTASPGVLLVQEWMGRHLEALPRLPPADFVLLVHCTEQTNAGAAAASWSAIFERLGQSLTVPQVGCCGMAGIYGHLRSERPISESIYKLSWERRVAASAAKGNLLATGYSCRSQAALMDGVRLQHPVQAILRLLKGRPAKLVR